MPLDKAVEATPDEPLLSDKGFKSPPNEKSAKPTARKSTGGAKRKPPAEESPRETTPSLQIVAVESGEAVSFNMPPNICIKPEPRNRGYADDEPEGEPTAEINHNEKIDEENAYINSLDFNNMAVKQEKDLDISDPTANGSEPEAMHLSHNGLERGSDSEDSDGEDSASSADEAEEAMEEDEGERIYREIELPLLEPENQGKEATQQSEEAAPENMEVQTPAAKPDVVGGVELPKESLETVGEVVQPQETPAADAPVETLPELETLQDLAALLEDSEITGEADPPQEAPKEVADTEPPLNTPEVVGETQHQSLESPEVLGEVEPQLETPEALAELEPPLLRSRWEKSDTERESPDCQADTLPEISLNAPKDIETQALPLNLEESSFICDEEQQNVLNHELSEQQAPLVGNVEQSAEAEEKLLAPVEEELPPQLEEELPGPSSRPNEETENRINEQQQEMDLEGQRQPRCQVEDDSNINEIAENNNNANIERELQDDANVPQENVTP
ncbi:GL13805 [Drosophila persimilis]|uniref:GL13805 n=1 Tax=Drosophila persimilis TaxID=7234 RepID=B4GP27_DROPE|nr:GL13805 [Drosophila persimilis]